MVRCVRTALLAMLSLLLFAASPSFGARGFSPPRALSVGGLAEQPQVAVSASGRTLAVWNLQGARFDLLEGRIDARLGRGSGSWGSAQTLGGGAYPLAAVGSDGVAAVAWAAEGFHGSRTLFVSVAKAAYGFGPSIRVVSGIGISEPAGLEVQPSGRVVLVWSRAIPVSSHAASESGIDFALLAPSGTRHTGSIGIAHGSPSVTETATGAVLVASQTVPQLPVDGQAAVSAQAQVSMLAPGASRFGSSETIFAVSGDPYAEADGIGAFEGSGGAAIAFSAEATQPNELDLAPLGPGGVFGSPLAATAINVSSGTVGYVGPVAALPADGAQVVAWTLQQLNNPTDQAVIAGRVMAAVRPAGATSFEVPTTLSTGKTIPSGPLAGSAGGATVVLWTQSAGCRQRVYYALRPAGGAFASASALSPTFTIQSVLCGHGAQTQLALSGAGNHLIAGWLQGDTLNAATLSQ